MTVKEPTEQIFWKQIIVKMHFSGYQFFLIPQTGSKKCQKNSSQHLVPLMGLL